MPKAGAGCYLEDWGAQRKYWWESDVGAIDVELYLPYGKSNLHGGPGPRLG